MPDARAELRAFALALPEAYEDFPWNESVAKVRRRVFVFLGPEGRERPAITVKLSESHGHALSLEGACRTGYGLGASGWVTVPVGSAPVDVLRDFVEESFRIVAPRRVVERLEGAAEQPM
jgi:predicted DNA-binding protein (MmcQ/YjbR family)